MFPIIKKPNSLNVLRRFSSSFKQKKIENLDKLKELVPPKTPFIYDDSDIQYESFVAGYRPLFSKDSEELPKKLDLFNLKDPTNTLKETFDKLEEINNQKNKSPLIMIEPGNRVIEDPNLHPETVLPIDLSDTDTGDLVIPWQASMSSTPMPTDKKDGSKTIPYALLKRLVPFSNIVELEPPRKATFPEIVLRTVFDKHLTTPKKQDYSSTLDKDELLLNTQIERLKMNLQTKLNKKKLTLLVPNTFHRKKDILPNIRFFISTSNDQRYFQKRIRNLIYKEIKPFTDLLTSIVYTSPFQRKAFYRGINNKIARINDNLYDSLTADFTRHSGSLDMIIDNPGKTFGKVYWIDKTKRRNILHKRNYVIKTYMNGDEVTVENYIYINSRFNRYPLRLRYQDFENFYRTVDNSA